nr:putative ribonuclease H-like domain-containing protein [Tanacetum cinerariifolium]
IVVTPSTEAEYVAAASCCGQVLWIQNQMLDYRFNFMNTTIFIDNQSTICIVKNPVFHQRTKHIEIMHHFIRNANEKNLIQVLKIHTDDNVADLLTKAFDGPRFEFLVVHIGMVVITAASCIFFLLTGWFLLVVLIPTGSFVPAGSYGLCWWLRVPAVRHTSAGGFISIGGVVYAVKASVQTADLICAGSIIFLLVDLFMLMGLRSSSLDPPPPMMAIAIGGNAAGNAPAGAAAGGDATDEANVVSNYAAGEFGPVPRPTGYVDPDDIEPIFFGPQPKPMDYVEPNFEVPIFFCPQPRPDNYVEPEEPDVIIFMEDDTIHGGFHVESPVQPNDASKPTADAAGRAEDPSMLTILFDKLNRCMGRIATLEKDLGTSKQVIGGAILKLVKRVKRLEKQAHLRR